MSSRPGAVEKHRRRHGETVALRQWENQVKRNPREMAKPTVRDIVLYLTAEAGERGITLRRLKAMVYLLTEMKAIRCPPATKQDIEDLGRELLSSDDPDDINVGSIIQNYERQHA